MDKGFLKYLGLGIIILVLKFMKEAGQRIKCVVMEFISMQMVLSIKESGKIISTMGGDNTNFPMEQIMKATGKII